MSVRVMSKAWDADLPPMEKLVLLALADCANDEGRCWPSAATIGRKSGQGERTVRRSIQALISKGHLTQYQRTGTSPIYDVHPCHTGTPASEAPLPNRPETPATQAPKPSGTVNTKEDKPLSNTRASFAAPNGVTKEQWAAFRKQRKKPINERSYTLLTNKLQKLAEDGWPPGDMIDLAIERGWETVFAPRNFGHERPDTNPLGTAVARVEAALRGSDPYG